MVLPALAKKITPFVPLFTLLSLALLAFLPLGCSSGETIEVPPPALAKWQQASSTFLTEYTELVGTTMPLRNRVAQISARVEGTVEAVLPQTESKPVAEGDRVSKGTVLVQLDTTRIKNSLADAESTQDSLVEKQKQAQIAVDLANREIERQLDLKREDQRRTPGSTPLFSAVDFEKASGVLKDAQSKFKGATSEMSAGAKKVEALREDLKLHTLTAPISGQVGRIQVVAGQWLPVGTVVADVIDIDEQIDVQCFVPSFMVGKLQLGQPAHVGPISAENEAEGEVIYIANQAEPETGNFAVKVRFANSDKKTSLRANRLIRFTVKTNPGYECLNLPESAIQEDEEKPTVVVVMEEKRMVKGVETPVFIARRLQVTLGLRDRKLHQVEILGLADPDTESPNKKPVGEVKDAHFITEGGQGVQTGDLLKLDVETDE